MAIKKATSVKKATVKKTAEKKATAKKASTKTSAKKTIKKAVKKAKPVSILEKAATDDALDYINAACEALASKGEISPKALQEFAMQMFAFGVSSGASVAMLDRFSEMKDYLTLE